MRKVEVLCLRRNITFPFSIFPITFLPSPFFPSPAFPIPIPILLTLNYYTYRLPSSNPPPRPPSRLPSAPPHPPRLQIPLPSPSSPPRLPRNFKYLPPRPWPAPPPLLLPPRCFLFKFLHPGKVVFSLCCENAIVGYSCDFDLECFGIGGIGVG